jgi:hypothetical protein
MAIFHFEGVGIHRGHLRIASVGGCGLLPKPEQER